MEIEMEMEMEMEIAPTSMGVHCAGSVRCSLQQRVHRLSTGVLTGDVQRQATQLPLWGGGRKAGGRGGPQPRAHVQVE
jgi:hypothetical protein